MARETKRDVCAAAVSAMWSPDNSEAKAAHSCNQIFYMVCNL